jgi:hypothetical protein
MILMMMMKMRKNLNIIFIYFIFYFSLWKYQQEINDLSESDIITANNNNSNYSFAKRFKKFRCPHCEHS